jgi:hypothetical protein
VPPSLDQDVIENLRAALLPKSTGSQWGGKSTPTQSKRNVRRIGFQDDGVRFGSQGPKHDRLMAELLNLQAGPANNYPRLRQKMTFKVSIAQVSPILFNVMMLISAPKNYGAFLNCQAVLQEWEFEGKGVRIALMPRGDDNLRKVIDGSVQVRTVKYNGPRSFEIDRPLEVTGPDMIAAFNDSKLGAKR